MVTIVFLPGHMCDARAWKPLADRLTAQDWCTTHARLDFDDTIDGMAHRVLVEHPGQLIPIGFSMGAIAALAMQRAAPERIAALGLVGINASGDIPERSAGRLVHQGMVRDGRLLEVIENAFMPAYFSKAFVGAQELHQLCLDMASNIGLDAFLRQSEALRTRPDARPGLGAIACPALVLGGEEDQLCPPEWHRETAAAIPDATLAIVPGGHMALIERPDDMADRIAAWLQTLKEQNLV